jgi:hypothetical protein
MVPRGWSTAALAAALLAGCVPAFDRPLPRTSSRPAVGDPMSPSTADAGANAGPAGPSPPPISSAPPISSSSPTPSAPRTWTAIFSAYLGPGTEGGCGRSGACHADEVKDAESTYEWLSRRGYIAGTQSALVSRTNSCLGWFGGNMPPRAMPNAQATRDLEAWVAGGALEN